MKTALEYLRFLNKEMPNQQLHITLVDKKWVNGAIVSVHEDGVIIRRSEQTMTKGYTLLNYRHIITINTED